MEENGSFEGFYLLSKVTFIFTHHDNKSAANHIWGHFTETVIVQSCVTEVTHYIYQYEARILVHKYIPNFLICHLRFR